MDVSPEMLRHAQETVSPADYSLVDISDSQLEQRYDFMSAWDSTFHLPLERQEPALKTMCDALKSKGVLIFTCGGASKPETISGCFRGEDFDYSTLGTDRYLELLREFGCECLHLEYDQPSPEKHVYIIARKR